LDEMEAECHPTLPMQSIRAGAGAAPAHGPRPEDGRATPSPATATSGNVAALLGAIATRQPARDALVVARTGERISFGELDAWSDRLAHGLRARGVVPGTRALVLLRPGTGFAAVSFALLKAGAVPVFVDPGLGRRNLLRCIADAAPEVLVADRAVIAVRPLLRRTFRSVWLVVSTRPLPGATTLSALASRPPGEPGGRFPIAPADDETPALVAFTSGATGIPKGVVFTHGVLHAQTRMLRDLWGIGADSVQLAVLPLLSLLGPGLGCASVLPDMDPSRPASASPRHVVEALTDHRVTHAFGSPAIWAKVARYGLAAGLVLPDLRVLLVGGAPVPPALLRDLGALLPRGRAHSPLGATEAITVASAPGPEIVGAAEAPAGALGTLVGRPVPGVEVRLVRIDDGPLEGDLSELEVPAGAPGEIVVRGPLVTVGYDQRPEADRLAKIRATGGDWHRMGDLGRFDAAGRLWFCGRKSERVETSRGRLLTACVEPLLEHPAVRRLALVGVGARPAQRAVVVAEARSAWTLLWPPLRRRIARELLARAHAHPASRPIEQVLFRRALPLDPRHAAKILRGELAAWASRRAP
jgi:acyl-CoA synthetase (AMP-forming)/AMP-acid ligase II